MTIEPRFFPLALLLACAACASFEQLGPCDAAAWRERSITGLEDGVRATAALVGADEIRSVFGVELGARGVQPVWLEIENGSDQPLFLFVSGVDPEYFAPLEIGHAFASHLSREDSARLQRHLSQLAFDHRAPIAPGTTVSGFLYTNQTAFTKVLDIDLLGPERATSITLFVPDPANREVAERFANAQSAFAESELVHLESDERLREVLERLPCCALSAEGEHVAPLNVVLIGRTDRVASTLQRRDYRARELAPLYVLDRPQILAGTKQAQWVAAQPQTVRLWATPYRYRADPVWLTLASSPRGGRFADDPAGIGPAGDDARDDVIEDLIYAQSVTKLGFVKGAGCPRAERAGVPTDGLRALVILDERAVSLAEIGLFDWERLVDYR